MNQIIISLVGALAIASIGIIGFYLRSAIAELKEVKCMALQTKSDLEVLKTDYNIKIISITEKITELKDAVKELTAEIKKLNMKGN